MPFNAASAQEIALETFGSLVTETPASNLPPGVSPDNQDVIYLPGAVASRPSCAKVFATQFPAGPPNSRIPTVPYGKSYVDPTGVIRNLYLDSNGVIHQEIVSSSPGSYSTLTTLASPGCYAKFITAFGREYIAPNDGLHGSDIPLQYDGTNLDRVTQEGPGAAPSIANSIIAKTAMAGAGNTLARSSNVVTARTAAAHNLLVGYRAQISGMTAATVGTSVSSIVINNEDSPGIATVTMTAAHGLVPGCFVNISNVASVAVGGPITATARTNGKVSIFTTNPHGLSAGAAVIIAGVTDASFDEWMIVDTVTSATTFDATSANLTNATSANGTVNLTFPGPSVSNDNNQYEVLTVPSTTSFTVALAWADGTWTSGSVTYGWDGIYFVASVVNSTTFTYTQAGPDATTTQVGTVTPLGQAAPGKHQMQVIFKTRQGYTTAPSPPVAFTANGGQYLSVTNIPIGPSNVVARILAFTGAGGANFFYIPVAPQINGQVVGTSTVVNDNTTTSVVLDFSDNTLFTGLATDIPGNNLAAQVVLDGALGFGFYASRLIAWGQRNRIQNLLNVMFDGGFLSGATTVPLGWTVAGAGSLVTSGRWGGAYQLGAASNLSQSFYLDGYGAPIGFPNTHYRARCWLKGATASVTFTISAASTGFSSTVTLTTTSTTGVFVEGAFSAVMPATIPTDMLFVMTGSSGTVDEISIIYGDTPYLDTEMFASYVNNPEGFDGVTGLFGAEDDTRKVMDVAIIRGTLNWLTQEPSGRLHQTTNNGVTEPAGWTVNEIASNCGLLSAYGLTKSQADDASASGGEEWIAWASASGARIFGGDQPYKISQELQPDWDNINPAAWLTVWALNDPTARALYFGLPIGGATAPNLIYPLSYRALDTAYQIAQTAPIHIGFSGKLTAHDNARKWTRWNLAMNGAALMYRGASPARLQLTLFNGNGQTAGAAAGFGNVYTLSTAKLVDDDYGQIFPYWTTHFFTPGEIEAALQLGGFRHLIEYLSANVSGVGNVVVTPYINTLTNPWPLTVTRALSADPHFDIEWGAANITGNRVAFKFASVPVP